MFSAGNRAQLWVAAERLQQWRLIHPQALCVPDIAAVSTRGFESEDRAQVLRELVRSRIVSIETARNVAVDKKKFATAPTAAVAGGGRRR